MPVANSVRYRLCLEPGSYEELMKLFGSWRSRQEGEQSEHGKKCNPASSSTKFLPFFLRAIYQLQPQDQRVGVGG